MGKDRDPSHALESISELDLKEPLQLILVGQVDENVLNRLKKIKNITIDYRGILDRSKSLEIAFNASILLLPLNIASNAKGRLPGKLYEYLRCGRPILALGPEESDASSMLEKTQTGKCFEYSDRVGIKNFISDCLNNKMRTAESEEVIRSFSNKNQTMKIAGYLDEIIK